jgi:NADPH:quinone reductase-like Zn-dependent oxidoreductase
LSGVSVASLGMPVGYEKLPLYFREKGASHGVDAIWFIVHPNREQLIKIGELIDSGYVKPIVDTVLPLSQADQAYEGAKSVHKHGKIVLRVI